MLANVVPPTNDFMVLARYLVHGKPGTKPSPDRVAWMISQNLPTTDPEQAAKLMTATAHASRRCKNAAYHAMIAWAEHEKPSPEVMQEIARKTLDLAGLAEHQALIMGHGDKPHPHLHMLINRVHPTTGKAWKTSHDYARFDRIMKQLAEEYGFAYVPAHRFNPDETDERDTKPNRRATWAAKRGAKTKRPQWSKRASRDYGAQLSERLDQAAGWDDVEIAFAEDGLTLEAKGTGLIVGTRQSYTKFSALGLTTTAHDLQKRFGSPYKNPTKHPGRFIFAVDAIDITKFMAMWGLATQDDVSKAIEDVTVARDAKRAEAPLSKQLSRDLRKLMLAATSLRSPSRPRAKPVNRSPVVARPKQHER